MVGILRPPGSPGSRRPPAPGCWRAASACSRRCRSPSMRLAISLAPGAAATQPLGQMRRVEGGRQTPGRDRRARRFGRGRRRQYPRCLQADQHPRSCRRRCLGLAIGPEALRRLRQRHQQRRLAIAELGRLLAEIEPRGGADALEIAAIGRQGQIHREDADPCRSAPRAGRRAPSRSAWRPESAAAAPAGALSAW